MDRRALALALGAATAAVALACSSGAVGVAACKQIEEARCRKASSANCSDVTLPTPYGSPADECIRYYDIDCLHGLAVATNPSSSEVTACVEAINDGDCGVVAKPQEANACAWLVPPADVDASDAAPEAEAGADAADAGEGE